MDMVKRDVIDYQEALRLSTNPENFALRFSGISSGGASWEAHSSGEADDGWDNNHKVFELDEDADHGQVVEEPKKRTR
jgi:twitching motility protein PilT